MRTLNRGGTKALDGFAEKRKLAILMTVHRVVIINTLIVGR